MRHITAGSFTENEKSHGASRKKPKKNPRPVFSQKLTGLQNEIFHDNFSNVTVLKQNEPS
jgi:hypothetical protein